VASKFYGFRCYGGPLKIQGWKLFGWIGVRIGRILEIAIFTLPESPTLQKKKAWHKNPQTK